MRVHTPTRPWIFECRGRTEAQGIPGIYMSMEYGIRLVRSILVRLSRILTLLSKSWVDEDLAHYHLFLGWLVTPWSFTGRLMTHAVYSLSRCLPSRPEAREPSSWCNREPEDHWFWPILSFCLKDSEKTRTQLALCSPRGEFSSKTIAAYDLRFFSSTVASLSCWTYRRLGHRCYSIHSDGWNWVHVS